MDPIDLTSLDIALQSNDAVKKDASTEDGISSPLVDDATVETRAMAEETGSDSETPVGEESSDGSDDESTLQSAGITTSNDSVDDSSVNNNEEESSSSQNELPDDTADGAMLHRSESADATVDSNMQPTQEETDANNAANRTNSSFQVETIDNTNIQHTNSTTAATIDDPTQEEEDSEEPTTKILVDYASKVSGGQILEKSPSLKGTSNLLTENTDRYAIAPCQDKKYVVIGLSEDILVKVVKIANYERYSSHIKEFAILSSQEYPVKEWTDLGTYTALSKSGEQTFELKEAAWARYLKFKFTSYYGVEHYCTVSQIKVHGSTMLQGFHEQWIESEKSSGNSLDGNIGDGSEEEEDGSEDHGDVVREDDGGVVLHDDDEIDTADGEDSDSETYREHEEEVGTGEETGVNNAELQGELSEPSGETALEDGTAVTDSITTEQQSTDQSIDPSESDMAVDETDETNQEADVVAVSPGTETHNSNLDNYGLAEQGDSDGSTVEGTEGKETASSELLDHIETQQVAIVDHQRHQTEENPSLDESINAKADTDETKSDAPLESQSNSDSNPDNEGNITLHGVADAVKAVVAHVTDELLHVKEAVQSADAVSEIKKIIRTTIGTEEGGTTELGAVDDVGHGVEENFTFAEQDSKHPDHVELEAAVNSDATSKERHIQADNETAVNGGAPPTTIVSEETANCTANTNQTALAVDTGNATKATGAAENTTIVDSVEQAVDNRTQAAGSSNANKTQAATSKTEASGSPKKNKTTTDTSAQNNASTLKVEPTATLPRKRDAIKSIDVNSVKQLLRRYPSASCLKDLDFQAFKAKSLVANPTLGSAAIGAGGAKMEPIFQKITNEIKSVQTTQHQYEQYIAAIMACYDKVLGDVANDINKMENKFENRLTVLEMMLKRSERRQKNSLSLFGVSLPPNFSPSAVAALLPFTVNVVSSEEMLVCLGMTVLFIFVWLVVGRRRAKSIVTASTAVSANSAAAGGLSPDKQTSEDESQSDDSNGIYPQPAQNIEFHPPSEITHQISCEESVDSIPSLPRSEPTGSSIHSPMKEARGRFRIRKRAKSDGTARTPYTNKSANH